MEVLGSRYLWTNQREGIPQMSLAYCMSTMSTAYIPKQQEYFQVTHSHFLIQKHKLGLWHHWTVTYITDLFLSPLQPLQFRCVSYDAEAPPFAFFKISFVLDLMGWGRRGGSGEIKERKRKRKRGITNPTQDRPAPKRLLKLEAMPPDTALSASGAGRGRGLARLSGYIAQPLYWLVILGKLLSHSAPQRSHP